jgi:hypothetical protein
MKIYVGNNKLKAKQITLKELIYNSLQKDTSFNNRAEINSDRFNDGSDSWIELKQFTDKKVVDIVIGFNTEDDNKIEDIKIWESKYKIDEDSSKTII